MIHFSRWKIALISLICVLGVLFAFPNFVSPETREALPDFLPNEAINLGLDLQGGSHLLLNVEIDQVIKEQKDDLLLQAKRELRSSRINYTRNTASENGYQITLRDPSDMQQAKSILRKLDDRMDISEESETVIQAEFTDQALRDTRDQTLSQSIEIVRRRIDETGTNEPLIQRQGDSRIVVQLPGLDNPDRVKELLGQTAKLSFHLVDRDGGLDTVSYPSRDEQGMDVAVKRQSILTGDMLVNASPAFMQGSPIVNFRLNGVGAKRFCDVTRKHQGEPFAIVLDKEIISAPRINEEICGGAAQISGNFTIQETTDLSLLLRAGALPAPLKIVEERTVGPTLGQDSVDAGQIAGALGLGAVLIFMIVSYGLFGVFAALALAINMVLIFAILSWLQATLTLPGIGGIILTIGMAVDANVLIFERIREELDAGHSVISAIDKGYSNAMSTIVDANMTTLIAAIFLYSFGSGPVRGFAVTLTIGIITSLFSAIWLTRLMVSIWVKQKKPKTLTV
ncbi:MAG: protein translocase subunit SecD [Alphaproteobacteria bacterium]|nr:protein translocase subunit SecD [Alphaproteobacteria bacterium]